MKIIYLIIVFSLIGYSLQLLTGIWLFVEKYGLSVESITEYILGNEEKFIKPKSLLGLLEVIVPHMFVIPLFTFVVLHFLYYLPVSRKTIFLAFIVFLSGVLETMSGLLIYKYSNVFSYVKLLSFVIFETVIFLSIFIVAFKFRKFHTL